MPQFDVLAHLELLAQCTSQHSLQFPTKSQAMSPSAAAAQERSAISFFLPHKQEVRPQVALCITPGGRSKSSPYCDSDDAGAVDHGDDVALCTYITHNSPSCKIHELLNMQNMPKIV